MQLAIRCWKSSGLRPCDSSRDSQEANAFTLQIAFRPLLQSPVIKLALDS
jgi:hypothetical protein